MTIMLRLVSGEPIADFVVDTARNAFAIEEGLQTSIVDTLGTDRRAPDNLRDQTGEKYQDPHGWWADFDDQKYPQGTLLWTLFGRKLTPSVIALGRQYIREGLQWMIDDKMVDHFDITGVRVNDHIAEDGTVIQRNIQAVKYDIAVFRPTDTEPLFILSWLVTISQTVERVELGA